MVGGATWKHAVAGDDGVASPLSEDEVHLTFGTGTEVQCAQ